MSTDLPVVVGVDGSAGSRAAAELAGYEASVRGRPLCIVTVFAPTGTPRADPTPPPD